MDKLEELRVWIRERVEEEEKAFKEAYEAADDRLADECDVAIWAYGEVLSKIRKMQSERT